MATLNTQHPETPTGASGPPVPPGWLANWSPEHNAWFYVYTPTGLTQWEYPTPPPDQQQQHILQGHPTPPLEHPQYAPAPGGDDTHVQDGDRGLGKAALALGGGFLAASSLKQKFEHHTSHSSHGHGLGNLTQTAAIAGAGAIGAKIFGLFGNKPQPQQQPQQPPPPQTQVHVYPVYVPGPQGVPPARPSPATSPLYHGQAPPMHQNPGYFPPGGAGGVPPAAPVPSQAPQAPQAPQAHLAGGVPPQIAPGVASFAPQSGPPLYIYGAMFADKDVTNIVRGLITPQQTLVLSGGDLCKQLGDPWPEAKRKMFNVLYSYGDRPMELLAAETETNNIEIKHEAISKKRMEFCQPSPSRIIAGVWGVHNPMTAARLEQLEKSGEMEGFNNVLGDGGFWGWEPRTLICYYRTEAGGVAIACCREGGTIRLPWNPLAKWS